MYRQSGDEFSRREFLKRTALTGAAAYLGLGYGIAAAEPSVETTRLRIRQHLPACWAPIHVAEPLLREEGFTDIQYLTGAGPQYPKMLEEGQVDVSPSFVALDLYNIDKHKFPLKIVAGLHIGCYALVGSKRLRSVYDLKGKTVWTCLNKYNGPHLFFSSLVSYVGLDPNKDFDYVWVKKDEALQMFIDGRIDAIMSFPPGPQELIDKNIGHLLVDTNVDKPWSQYYCCMISFHSDFVKKYPVATKRATRAILKANDIVARDPQHSLEVLMKKKIWKKSETKYVLKALQDIPYDKWRHYHPEDTIRFFALRLNEVNMIDIPPEDFIAQYTDWSFLNSLKSELAMTW